MVAKISPLEIFAMTYNTERALICFRMLCIGLIHRGHDEPLEASPQRISKEHEPDPD